MVTNRSVPCNVILPHGAYQNVADANAWLSRVLGFTEYDRVKAAGGKIVEALQETIYGERQYGVEDLKGHCWLFSHHIRDMSSEEWGASLWRQPVS